MEGANYLGSLGWHKTVENPMWGGVGGHPKQNGTLSFEFSCDMTVWLLAPASFVRWQPFQAGGAINLLIQAPHPQQLQRTMAC